MEEQTNTTNWLDEELKNNQSPTGDFERLEALKLEDGKVIKFTVDFSQPFKKWTQKDGDAITVKAIIPVTHKDIKKNLWVNTKNPLYHQLCERGKKGQVEFRVSTTGTQKLTRYTIVEED